MLSQSEIEKIENFTGIKTDYPADKSIAGLFEEIVALYPNNPAVFFKGRTVTYDQLNSKADDLANVLIENGIKKNMSVAILTEKSFENIIGILGILKAGGVYVPIDPLYPCERINFILKDSACRILLTQHKFDDLILNVLFRLYLDQPLTVISGLKKLPPDSSPSDLAYIMYTSGTTGIPKGVMVTQKGVVRLVKNTNYLNIDPSDRVAFINAVIFDASTFELWGTLLNGACLFIIDKKTVLDPDLLGKMLLSNNITISLFTGSLFNKIFEFRDDIFSGLNYLLVGGEVLSPSHINAVRRSNPDLKVINVYGPTENTTFSTTYLIEEDFDKNIPIGKPVSNSTAYIFDEGMNYTPVGVIGELYLGGDGLSIGYLNRDDLNERSFVEHPYRKGERLYRTGDLARWLEDGNIEFHGRKDNQVKIRGFRVELEEIESVISSLDGVTDAVVKPIEHNGEIYGLFAFVNITKGSDIDAEAIRGGLIRKLPSYMIPVSYRIMHGFPVTLSGKTDRRALIPDIEGLSSAEVIEEGNLTSTESLLSEIWKGLLNRRKISVHDNFFDLGGSSLLTISAVNKIKQRTGFSVTYRDFILHPTLSGLGSFIDSASDRISEQEVRLIRHDSLMDLPLSVNQRRIWLNCIIQPDSPAYNIPLTWKIKGKVDQQILEESLNLLFHRHQIVFSRIMQKNGEPFCNILPEGIKVKKFDYTGINDEDREKSVISFIDEESREVFDLEDGPLFRLFLIKTAEEEQYFHMTIHHIIFDGWSLQVFVRELGEIYNKRLLGEVPGLKEVKFQQYDYAYWEKEQLVQTGNEDLTDFWKDYLEGVSPVINFPYDFQRIDSASGKGEREIFILSSDITDKLKEISRTEDTTLFITMLSAFSLLINKYTGDSDFCIGLPVAYRPHSNLENIFGMFVNTIVLRNRISGSMTFRELVRSTRDSFLSAHSNQGLPFENIVEVVHPQGVQNMNPLFQVCFAWQNNINLPIILKGTTSERITGNGGTAPFDLTFYMWENEGSVETEIEYSIDLLKRETVIRMRDRFILLVEHLVKDPESVTGSLSLISEEETDLINSVNNTRTEYPKHKSIPELFKGQVYLHPERTALVFKGDSITYKQLDERADQLAIRLKAAGIDRNIPVGLLADKSLELIIGMLGILKAGGVYVPIDPDYPEQRIDYIIRDSDCKVVITGSKHNKKIPADIRIIDFEGDKTRYDKLESEDAISDSSDLAYIMYTSGTTGRPKGSMINQYSIIRLIRNTNYIEITQEDRILLTSSLVFDAATFEIWGALLNGAALYIAEKETLLDPEALWNELRKNGITILWLTSALFTMISDVCTDIFGGLKYLLVGGDVLSAPHINRVRRSNPGLKVINGYGPTENTTFSTTYLIEKDFEKNIPIGKPVSNSTAYIFDESMNYTPVGVIGELYVGGDGLSIGYLNRDDLNERSFVEHPYRKGERLYCTGDLARWLEDGNIEFHGRKDNQVKIRGFRVELGEIESSVSKIPEVSDVVVKLFKEGENIQRIVAFIDVTENFSKNSEEIAGFLKEQIPYYMIPSDFMIMHGFPLNLNGKVDIHALTFDLKASESARDIIQQSMTPTEEKISRIWKDILKNEKITPSDNFFDVGGNSLLAVSVIFGIESEFNIRVKLGTFFNNPSIRGLAEYIKIRTKDQGSEFKDNKYNSNIIEGLI